MIPERIRQQVFAALGCPPETVKLLGGYSDNVFELERAGEENIVVKILDRTVIPEEQTLSELEWLSYLKKNGVNAVRPLYLKPEEFIHSADDRYYYVQFHKVQGEHVTTSDLTLFNTELFERWGEAMGRLHTSAKSYKAVHPRPQWSEHPILQAGRLEADSLLSQKWKVYEEEFSLLGTSRDEFGLIHGDLHHHNFLLQDGELTLIDFGDAEYHWFAYDVAITVYHMAQSVPEGAGKKERVLAFFNSFMNGYRRGNRDTGFIAQVDYFIDYRYLFSYTYHTVYSDLDALTDAQKAYLAQMRRIIAAGGACMGFRLL